MNILCVRRACPAASISSVSLCETQPPSPYLYIQLPSFPRLFIPTILQTSNKKDSLRCPFAAAKQPLCHCFAIASLPLPHCFPTASLPLRRPHALRDRLIHGPEFLLMAQEQVGQHRIKVAAPAFPDNAGTFFMGEGLFIHSLGPQRVVYIGQGHDAG